MRTLRQPVFIVLALVFVAHQLLQKNFHIALPWLDSYLDPLLCLPILLTLVLAERRHIFGKGDAYQFSKLEVGLAVLTLSIVFEVVFPALSARFTADWLDVLAYVAGGIGFYYLLNRKL